MTVKKDADEQLRRKKPAKKTTKKVPPVDPPINEKSSGAQASVTDSSGSVSLSDVVGLGMIATGINALSSIFSPSDNTEEATVASEDLAEDLEAESEAIEASEATVASEDLAEAFEVESEAIEASESSSDNDGGGGGPGMGSSDDGGGGGGGGGGE